MQELEQDIEVFKAIMNHIDPENKRYNRRLVIKKVRELAGKHSNCLVSKVYREYKSTRLE